MKGLAINLNDLNKVIAAVQTTAVIMAATAQNEDDEQEVNDLWRISRDLTRAAIECANEYKHGKENAKCPKNDGSDDVLKN